MAEPSQPRSGAKNTRTEFALTESDSVITAPTVLSGLATVLSENIFDITGLRLNTSSSENPSPSGGISLALDSSIAGVEGYTLVVDGHGVQLRCSNFEGCARGMSTIAQSVCVSGVNVQTVALPCMNITDSPDAPYRGFLVDTARSEVTLHQLYDIVVYCAFFKIRYMHLHLTDDHGWSIKMKSDPLLGTKNVGFRGPVVVPYNQDDLRKLNAYAAARGVYIIPEIEGPGHSSAMRRADPFFQGVGGDTPQGGGVMNVANDTFYVRFEELIAEIADIFDSSPYIHIGCDETSTPSSLPGYKQFTEEHGIKSEEDLFAYYVKTLADMVKKRNKTAIVWGYAPLDRCDPGDVVAMVYLGGDEQATSVLSKGFEIINCPNPVGSMSDEFYKSLYDFSEFPGISAKQHPQNIPPNPKVIGAQVNMWERGWGWGLLDFGDAAIGRTAGPGWWASTWPRNNTAELNSTSLDAAYTQASRTRTRLRPPCSVTGPTCSA